MNDEITMREVWKAFLILGMIAVGCLLMVHVEVLILRASWYGMTTPWR